MTKTFKHLIILLITLSVGVAIGYFEGRKRMLRSLEENRQEYAKELATQDSLIRNNQLQLNQYQQKVVSLDEEIKDLKKTVGKERVIYRNIEPLKTTNEVVRSLKQIVNESD